MGVLRGRYLSEKGVSLEHRMKNDIILQYLLSIEGLWTDAPLTEESLTEDISFITPGALSREPVKGAGALPGEPRTEMGSSRLLERAFNRVDDSRREKAAAMKPGRAQAASLGAGLLLQLALGEMTELSGDGIQRKKGFDLWDRGEAFGERGRPAGQERAGVQEVCAGQEENREQSGSCPAGNNCFSYGIREYTADRLLTRLESMPRFPAAYRYGERGKPYFKDYPYYFSLSHSGDYVLCVISGSNIGADIQEWRKCDRRRLAERFFSAQERKALEFCRNQGSEEETRLFFRLWSRKEAYGKLTGKGIADAAGVNLLPGRETLPENKRLCWTENLDFPGYSRAVCRYA